MDNGTEKKRYYCQERDSDPNEYKKYLGMSQEERDRLFEKNLKEDIEYTKKYGLHNDV